jgi:NADH:ubiquinone oxidoreductase subunit 6 (subunit J)
MPADQIVQVVIFAVFTVMTLGGGLGVVSARNLFHSALFLVLSFAGVVGYYVLLDAGFLAAVQLLIYIGAIAVLILFAIMLSRGLMAERQRQRNEQWWIAALVTLLIFVVLAVVLWQVDWPIASDQALTSPSAAISRQGSLLGLDLLGPYVIPFEVASVLLLVALVGAVILARETES